MTRVRHILIALAPRAALVATGACVAQAEWLAAAGYALAAGWAYFAVGLRRDLAEAEKDLGHAADRATALAYVRKIESETA